jgi:cation diffusion facilitator family transporter
VSTAAVRKARAACRSRTYLRISIAVALATIALKTGAWWISGSVSLLSDAMESLVNLAGAMFALAMVTVAARPPDDDHPYGHHKAEYFSSGFEGVLIFAAAAGIIWAAVLRLINPQPLESVNLGLVLSVVSSAMNGLLAWSMLRKARSARSTALEADARHLFTDVWTSAGVVLGLLAVQATGWLLLDPLIAIAVALNIMREGGRLIAGSADGLMDQPWSPMRGADRPGTGGLRPSDHSLRPRRDAPRGPAPFCRPAHAHAGRLDAGPRGGGARQCGTGADERRAGPARHDPAACRWTWKRTSRTARTRCDRAGAAGRRGAGRSGRRRSPAPSATACWCWCVPSPPTAADQVARLVDKLLKLRIFSRRGRQDEPQRAGRAVGLLIVSQFTLAADTRRQPAQLHRGRAGRTGACALRRHLAPGA